MNVFRQTRLKLLWHSVLYPIQNADATQLSSWVASLLWTHPSAVVTQFKISCAVELLRLVTDKWRHNDVIVDKVINIHKNSRSQTAMFSFQIVGRIRRQSSWASCELCSHRRRRRDATRQLRRVGVGGVYWALVL